MSSTFTILEVSQPTYVEISKALKKAGYSVERDGEINMEGLHLKQKEALPITSSFPKPFGRTEGAHLRAVKPLITAVPCKKYAPHVSNVPACRSDCDCFTLSMAQIEPRHAYCRTECSISRNTDQPDCQGTCKLNHTEHHPD